MQAAIIVRPATLDDAPAIAEIHIRSWQWAYRGLLPADYLDGLAATLNRRIEARRRLLEQPPAELRWWVVEHAGRVAGFADTGPCNDSDVSPMTAEVFTIYLTQDAAGKGLGRALFSRAVEDFRQRGYTQAVLWVLDMNVRARRFYEAAGWTPDGKVKNEERSGHILHEVRYRLYL